MKPAEIAGKVNEGVKEMEHSQSQKVPTITIRQYIAGMIEIISENPGQCNPGIVADDFIARVRAYLIVDAELPENPYREQPTILVHGIDVFRAYSHAQQDMLAAGWRKVKEARE